MRYLLFWQQLDLFTCKCWMCVAVKLNLSRKQRLLNLPVIPTEFAADLRICENPADLAKLIKG